MKISFQTIRQVDGTRTPVMHTTAEQLAIDLAKHFPTYAERSLIFVLILIEHQESEDPEVKDEISRYPLVTANTFIAIHKPDLIVQPEPHTDLELNLDQE